MKPREEGEGQGKRIYAARSNRIFFRSHILPILRSVKHISVLLACAAMASPSLSAAPLSNTDRQQLLDHLYKTRQLLVETLRGLTSEQLNFKPAPDRWSILQCAEHLTLAEPFLMTRVEKGTPVEKGKPAVPTDDTILKDWGTAAEKVKAPPVITPTGQWPDVGAALKEFDQRRAKTIQYVAETNEDLRGKICCGGMEVFQQILGLSAHVERHVTQMRDVKADPKYPKP